MSILTLAIVNGVLAVAVLAALGYVCSLPFRLVTSTPESRFTSLPAMRRGDVGRERIAA